MDAVEGGTRVWVLWSALFAPIQMHRLRGWGHHAELYCLIAGPQEEPVQLGERAADVVVLAVRVVEMVPEKC